MTNSSVRQVFDDHAAAYDALRRRLVPVYDDFYGAAVGALGLAGRRVHRVLDLGAGTGLLTRHVLDALPDVEVTLLDGSAAMLDQARDAFGERAAYVPGDLDDELPAGPWDAIVSGLAIHHLRHEGKRALFVRVIEALAPRGVFVNAEQVAGTTALFGDANIAWHEQAARALGATTEEWEAAIERMRHDRYATVEQQLAWLREAGFADADCVFKQHSFAVLVARRAD